MDIVTSQIILTMPSSDINALEYDEVFGKLEETLNTINSGIGLAAVQINIMKRAFIVKYGHQIYRFANTTIEEGEGSEWGIEGCLSIPGREFGVQRSTQIVVTDDINGTQTYTGLLARIIQHEHDHTKGITLIQSGREI